MWILWARTAQWASLSSCTTRSESIQTRFCSSNPAPPPRRGTRGHGSLARNSARCTSTPPADPSTRHSPRPAHPLPPRPPPPHQRPYPTPTLTHPQTPLDVAKKAAAAGAAAAMLTLSPLSAVANEFDILGEPAPTNSFYVDDASVLSKSTRSAVNKKLSLLQVREEARRARSVGCAPRTRSVCFACVAAGGGDGLWSVAIGVVVQGRPPTATRRA